MTTYNREKYLKYREKQIKWSQNYYKRNAEERKEYAKKYNKKKRKLQKEGITRYGVPYIIYEDLMIKENYGKLSDLELSKIIGRTVASIIRRRSVLFNSSIRSIYGIRKYRV